MICRLARLVGREVRSYTYTDMNNLENIIYIYEDEYYSICIVETIGVDKYTIYVTTFQPDIKAWLLDVAELGKLEFPTFLGK